MKKTILVAMMAISLTGCVDSLSDLDNNTRMTNAEQGYIIATGKAADARDAITNGYESGTGAGDDFRRIWWDLASAANSKRKNLRNEDEVNIKPFCDILEEVRMADYRVTTQFPKARTLQSVYQEITGKTLDESCGVVPAAIPVARTVQTDRTGNGEPELAPETYGLMIDAAKSCERARISLMSYPSGYVFTKKDYNKIMNLVNDCKRFELESSINTK